MDDGALEWVRQFLVMFRDGGMSCQDAAPLIVQAVRAGSEVAARAGPLYPGPQRYFGTWMPSTRAALMVGGDPATPVVPVG